jgi:hypothetical protein
MHYWCRGRASLTPAHRLARMHCMTQTQFYLQEEELEALRERAKQSGQSVSELVREAVRRVWLRPASRGPVGLWEGEPRRSSVDHDSIYDEP